MHLNRISTLEVVLTSQCNLRCGYCYQTAKKSRSMDWSTLRAGLDRLLASTARSVTVAFIGGEPLLEFPLIERAVAYLNEMRRPDLQVHLSVITNGTLLNDVHGEFFAANDFELQLSFDGVPEAQDLRGRGTFHQLDRLVDRLRQAHPDYFAHRVRVATTLTPQTIGWFPDSIAYFCAKDIRDIVISPEFTATAWHTERIAELDRAFARVFETIVDHYHRTGHVPLEAWRDSRAPASTAQISKTGSPPPVMRRGPQASSITRAGNTRRTANAPSVST
jgi:sulfatase maturation enzyme AslB (radical SAM superfamily)